MFKKVSTVASASLGSSHIDQIKVGDFNGDGNLDFIVTQIDQSWGGSSIANEYIFG